MLDKYVAYYYEAARDRGPLLPVDSDVIITVDYDARFRFDASVVRQLKKGLHSWFRVWSKGSS